MVEGGEVPPHHQPEGEDLLLQLLLLLLPLLLGGADLPPHHRDEGTVSKRLMVALGLYCESCVVCVQAFLVIKDHIVNVCSLIEKSQNTRLCRNRS